MRAKAAKEPFRASAALTRVENGHDRVGAQLDGVGVEEAEQATEHFRLDVGHAHLLHALLAALVEVRVVQHGAEHLRADGQHELVRVHLLRWGFPAQTAHLFGAAHVEDDVRELGVVVHLRHAVPHIGEAGAAFAQACDVMKCMLLDLRRLEKFSSCQDLRLCTSESLQTHVFRFDYPPGVGQGVVVDADDLLLFELTARLSLNTAVQTKTG